MGSRGALEDLGGLVELAEFIRGKRVLVTGHTGFKGAWLTKIVLDMGAVVCGYGLKPNTEPNLFDILEVEKEIEHHIADIRDAEAFNKAVKDFKPEIIFHLAAQPLVRDSYDDPQYTYETNILGTVYVLEAMRANQVPTGVIITTDKVYKNMEQDIAYKEEDALGGYDPYSTSKAGADLVIDSYIKSFFNPADWGKKHKTLIASARAGNVIGGGDWTKDRIIPDIMKAILQKNEQVIIRSPKAVRPWQHVFESLYGYLLLAKALHEGDLEKVGAWNFGPREEDMLSVQELLERTIKRLEKGSFRIEEDKSKHEAGFLKLDSTKAREKLNWQPRYNIDQALKATIDWYGEFYRGNKDMKGFSETQIKDYFK